MENNICKPCNQCQEDGCTTKVHKKSFETKYCWKHSKYCKEIGCKITGAFNYESESKGLYCKSHSKENMIDIHHIKCLDCNKRPSFNFKNETKSIYCSKHKKENMVDITSKYCIEPGCKISASYNYKNKPSLYCGKHRKENMVCIKVNLCVENNCTIQPNFNYKNETFGVYCSKHKKENMVDIKHKLCIHDNCFFQGGFNIKGETKGIYCSKHKLDNMVDIKHKLCKNEGCQTFQNKKYEGYCLFCFIHLFPDKPVSRNYKTKEKTVNDFIKEQFKNMDWVNDKKIFDGCSKRRPDLLVDIGNQIIIIEIDENQHENYSCENKRIMEISQDLAHRPIIFIRFNPDNYFLNDSKITSCWDLNGNGILTIKKSKQKEWNERLAKLKETVCYWLNNQSEKTIEIVHLFYNNYVKTI